MKSSIFLALASLMTCCLTRVVAPDPSSSNSFHTSEAVVMNQGDVWKEGEHHRYHHNRCEVMLQRDGNFVVKRIIAPNPWHQFLRTAWTSGSAGTTSGFFRSKLEQDGSLVVLQRDGRGKETLVYTSNVGEPEAFEDYDLNRTHKLVVSEGCILTAYCDGKAVWTNNRYCGLGGESGLSDYLQKGEMMYLNQCYQCGDHPDCVWGQQALLLQHDCNLVHFAGRDLADLKENPAILWSSGTPRPDLQDCYLYSDADKVRLYEGKLDKTLPQFFAPRDGDSYWETNDDFKPECSGGYEVLLNVNGGLEPSC